MRIFLRTPLGRAKRRRQNGRKRAENQNLGSAGGKGKIAAKNINKNKNVIF